MSTGQASEAAQARQPQTRPGGGAPPRALEKESRLINRAKTGDREVKEATLAMSTAPAHTCHAGPLCATAEDPAECSHASCAAIVHEDCEACFREAMAEAADEQAQATADAACLNRGYCPVDMTPVTFRAHVAAPGYGTSWECRCGHPWHQAGGTWYRPDLTEPPLLTLADVR
jgi:hypothetical protein